MRNIVEIFFFVNLFYEIKNLGRDIIDSLDFQLPNLERDVLAISEKFVACNVGGAS